MTEKRKDYNNSEDMEMDAAIRQLNDRRKTDGKSAASVKNKDNKGTRKEETTVKLFEKGGRDNDSEEENLPAVPERNKPESKTVRTSGSENYRRPSRDERGDQRKTPDHVQKKGAEPKTSRRQTEKEPVDLDVGESAVPKRSSKKRHQIIPFLLFVLAIFLVLTLILVNFTSKDSPMGLVGDILNSGLLGLFGWGAFSIPVMIVLFGVMWRTYVDKNKLLLNFLITLLTVALFSAVLHLFIVSRDVVGKINIAAFWKDGIELKCGGVIGGLLGAAFFKLFKYVGTAIIVIAALLVCLMVLVEMTPRKMWTFIRYKMKVSKQKKAEKRLKKEKERKEREAREAELAKRRAEEARRLEEDEQARRKIADDDKSNLKGGYLPAGSEDDDIIDDYDDGYESDKKNKNKNKKDASYEKSDADSQRDIRGRKGREDAGAGKENDAGSFGRGDDRRERGGNIDLDDFEFESAKKNESDKKYDFDPVAEMLSADKENNRKKNRAKDEKSDTADSDENEKEIGNETDGDELDIIFPRKNLDPIRKKNDSEFDLSSVFGDGNNKKSDSGKAVGGSAGTAGKKVDEQEDITPVGIDEDVKSSSDSEIDIPDEEDDELSKKEDEILQARNNRIKKGVLPKNDAADKVVDAEDDNDNDNDNDSDDDDFDDDYLEVEEENAGDIRSGIGTGGGKNDVKEQLALKYVFPPITLLTEPVSPRERAAEELEENKEMLRQTLESFKIRVKDITYCQGPTITRYEVKPEQGIRVRSITNLVDDIAMNLSTSGVRIEAPIPGKSAVGIEVPNPSPATVYLRSLISNEKFKNGKSKLTACLGADVGGDPIIFDIAKMPHLLIAGATGMGKSVCINSIIVSLLYKATPEEVKLILIDPKKVEFNMYKDIPHLYAPIVSDPKKAAGALASAVAEMERRFELIEDAGVRDISGYNKDIENDPDRQYMPQMVIIIDELADLMMTAPDEVESSICRLAQKARAAGIHLIIGTQRPSVDVITGLIKANVPSRIACTVASQVDSRTIIDIAGAEKLIGRGDMLYAPVGLPKPMRVQGAFVSDSEVERIVEYIRTNNDKAHYDEEFTQRIELEASRCGNVKKGAGSEDGEADSDDMGSGEVDPKFREAVELAIDFGKISTSLLQRRLEVGYGRAAKLIDKMEELGYVSAPDGNKPRKILITKQDFMEKVINDDIDQ